jgi:hypothetical protein
MATTDTDTQRSTSRRRPAAPSNGEERTSRAVLRDVEPGSSVDCVRCGERVKFQAKVRNKQVICNVYEHGSWVRVEHFHDACYTKAKRPHGPVDRRPVLKARQRQAAAS